MLLNLHPGTPITHPHSHAESTPRYTHHTHIGMLNLDPVTPITHPHSHVAESAPNYTHHTPT